MNPHRIYAIIYRYFSILRGSPDRIMGLYIWMFIDIIQWGFISTYLNQVVSSFNAISVFLGAVLLSNFASRVMLNINMTFFEDMWARNFLNLFASPLRISEYLTGLILCGILTSGAGLILAFLTAALVFGFSPVEYGLALIPFIFILYLFGIALGILGCSIVLARGPASEWFIWPIPALIIPFVGVYYPISTLPHWMQATATILPPSYVFEGVRGVLSGHPANVTQLTLGILLAFVYIALASIVFLHVYRKAMRTGLIARYSAENAN
ncbi:MAG: ABC transporter permease [Rickettsiales bacterium]